jgi:hypothetical protein
MAKFRRGQSGNPTGRPKGTGTAAKMRALLEPHAPRLVEKAVQLALSGDTTALRICIDRLIPAMKLRDEPVLLEGFEGSLTEQGQAVIKGMGGGSIAPGDASEMLRVLASQARIAEIDELEQRINALEDRNIIN